MGTRWTCFKGRIEIQFESLVLGQGRIVRDFEYVDFVVAFEVNDACGIFVQEVVRDHKSAIVLVQHEVMRSGVRAEAHYRYLLRIEAVS